MSPVLTGANRAHKGLFQQADGGTLFLDEIGEMPLPLQAKLLRVLQEGTIRPVGAERELSVDVRIIAASNRPLETEAGREAFREDLFFRLETFILQVPPLRDREDLELLAAGFVAHFAARGGRPVRHRAGGAGAATPLSVPGNVRELQNAIERAVTFCHGRSIELEHLPSRIASYRDDKARSAGAELLAELSDGPLLPTLEELELRYIEHVLKLVDGNKPRGGLARHRTAHAVQTPRRARGRLIGSPQAPEGAHCRPFPSEERTCSTTTSCAACATLKVSDAQMAEIAALGGCTVAEAEVRAWLSREDEDGYQECPDEAMARFRRADLFQAWQDESRPAPPLELPVSNNQILKKLRVAFELRDEDLQAILHAADLQLSKSELGALFRKPGHSNYRPCGDQLLRNFLKGLSLRQG